MTELADQVRMLAESGLFDEAWYVERYPDVLRSAMSPTEHYVRVGQHLGRRSGRSVDNDKAVSFLAACRPFEPAEANFSAGLYDTIARYGLFDAEWYRQQHADDVIDDVDLIANYLRRSALDPSIDPGPLFSTAGYAKANSDSKKIAPLIHACTHGVREGRPVFDADKVDRFLLDAKSVRLTSFKQLLSGASSVQIVCWKGGNFFFSEIAEYLRVLLEKQGYNAGCSNDLPRGLPEDTAIVVVAPHEFCVHGPGQQWNDKQRRKAIYLNTEQWHTGWFSLSYEFLSVSKKAFDINPASAAGLQRLGIDTAFLPILPMPNTPFKVERADLTPAFADARYILPLTYPEKSAQRPYDVLFIGASSARREAGLAALAPVLADFQAFIHCPRFTGPVRDGNPDMMPTSDIVQVARNTKILLNIHQGPSRYFEWHRLMLFGIMEGCIVLTEPSIPNIYVEGGKHFLECSLDEMPHKLHWLLDTSAGRAEIERILRNCVQLGLSGDDWKGLAK